MDVNLWLLPRIFFLTLFPPRFSGPSNYQFGRYKGPCNDRGRPDAAIIDETRGLRRTSGGGGGGEGFERRGGANIRPTKRHLSYLVQRLVIRTNIP